MGERLIVSFDHSQEDVPTLVIGHENFSLFGSPSLTIDNIITGNRAEEIWNELKKEANNNVK